LALACLFLSKAAVGALSLAVLGLLVAARIHAIDVDFADQLRRGGVMDLRAKRFPQLVRENEGGLVLAIQVAAQLERAMTLGAVREDYHICFAVDDFESEVRRLRASGIVMRNDIMLFHDRKLVFISGPEGVTVELAE
jgi:hypothetical protein